MCKKLVYLTFISAVLILTKNTSAEMLAYYPMDEGSGTIIIDASGNGHDATIDGTVNWVQSKPDFGTALSFPGTAGNYVRAGTWNPSETTGQLSLAVWIKWAGSTGAYQGIIAKADGTGTSACWQLTINNAATSEIGFAGGFPNWLASAPPVGQWEHIAVTYDGTTATMYVDGVNTGTNVGGTLGEATTSTITIGARTLTSPGDAAFNGIIDDVKIFNHALSEAEVQQAMLTISKVQASSPEPEDDTEDVIRDVILSWNPGESADKHNVYFGTIFDDVNNADTGSSLLVSPAHDANNYNPGRLEFSQTYYWRVDEVNAPPDSTVFKGDVWSFTVEPYAIPIDGENITATASGNVVNQGPEKTIDGSGLDANDLHSITSVDMWLSSPGDPGSAWIQYEFDKPYKLHEMLIWNYNGNTILALFGIKEVTIEYSADGVTWTQSDVSELAQASGDEGYAANTIVPFNSEEVKYVKITANGNYGGGAGLFNQYGLSEVRFMVIPVFAREPSPQSETTDAAVASSLTWRAGREVAEHNVYLNTDRQSVIDGAALLGTTSQASYSPALELSSTYYWRVDEVNNAEAPSIWQGDIWSFSTQEYLVVDDFESYNDIPTGQKGSNLVYDTWMDGISNPSKGGSQMGYFEGSSLETGIVHGGNQSVPLFYDNASSGLSEVTANTSDLPIGGNWSTGSPQTLVLWIHGDLANTAADRLYAKIGNTKVMFDGDLSVPLWKQWNIDLTGMNLNNVATLSIGIEGSGSGMIFLDDFMLYRIAPPVTVPTDPGTNALVAYYALDNNVEDSSGNNLNGTIVGTPSYITGVAGMALSLNGVDDYVNCGDNASFDITEQITLSAWVNTSDSGNGQHNPFVTKGDQSYAIKHASGNSMEFFIYDGTWQTLSSPVDDSFNGAWHHVAGTFDGNQLRLYVDGNLADSMDHTGAIATTTYPVNIGRNSQNVDRFYEGAIDEVRIYNRALSEGEIRYIAGDK